MVLKIQLVLQCIDLNRTYDQLYLNLTNFTPNSFKRSWLDDVARMTIAILSPKYRINYPYIHL